MPGLKPLALCLLVASQPALVLDDLLAALCGTVAVMAGVLASWLGYAGWPAQTAIALGFTAAAVVAAASSNSVESELVELPHYNAAGFAAIYSLVGVGGWVVAMLAAGRRRRARQAAGRSPGP